MVNVIDEYGDELMLSTVDAYYSGQLIKSGYTDSINFSAFRFDSLKIDLVGHQPYTLIPEDMDGYIYHVYLKTEIEQRMRRKRIMKISKRNLITESGLTLRRQL